LGNISDKKLWHLQSHFGQVTLSWNRIGVQCTGVDISEVAIALIQSYAKELAIDANFVCCNVLDASKHITNSFDIIFLLDIGP
jgi:2-polyprenyl-3-methyl-5-hydroxy-6-metoxy-1,4-benzoquinol methylase